LEAAQLTPTAVVVASAAMVARHKGAVAAIVAMAVVMVAQAEVPAEMVEAVMAVVVAQFLALREEAADLLRQTL